MCTVIYGSFVNVRLKRVRLQTHPLNSPHWGQTPERGMPIRPSKLYITMVQCLCRSCPSIAGVVADDSSAMTALYRRNILQSPRERANAEILLVH